MPNCTKCKLPKEESEFFFKNKATGKLHSYCKQCKRELDRLSYRKDGNARAEKIRFNARKSIKRAKEFVRELKMQSVCRKCKDNRWYVLDFHHLENKEDTISMLVHKGPSMKKLQAEIAKCEILCSNCHREEHYFKRLNGAVAPTGRALH